ncbi:hypothetical protein BpHYR1_000712 [Brachionus plicatilis]|uniref:Uncharacterized protein n=1 Tax=Brachionus plicatilis TaxID=10195 RepID=A0A3M7SCA6_BRAPC|nr:hypothetical protein BpHYR1_000712 [Brachionus plicatilis]
MIKKLSQVNNIFLSESEMKQSLLLSFSSLLLALNNSRSSLQIYWEQFLRKLQPATLYFEILYLNQKFQFLILPEVEKHSKIIFLFWYK